MDRKVRRFIALACFWAALCGGAPAAWGVSANWTSSDLDVWFYTNAISPGSRALAPTFLGGVAIDEEMHQFEPSTVAEPARLGATLLAFNTSSMVNVGLPVSRYQVNSVKLTATWTYDSDPNVLLYQDTPITQGEVFTEVSSGNITRQKPFELYGVGLRAGYTGYEFASPISGPPLVDEITHPYSASDGGYIAYGGHIGEEHEHSAANLSKHFRRIQLDGGTQWQELPMQTPLQGLPLVAHGGNIYRIGGLNERNPTTNETEDLHSTADFAEYDPVTKKWTDLAPLPAGRSSHNAAVIGDRLYVVGGWKLDGKSPGAWQPDALVYDFDNPSAGWQKLPRPDFKRRALAAASWRGQLFALGGMNEKAKPTVRVDVFDPKTGKWSQGPKLPGDGMHDGFGVSAWNLNGDVYVSGLRGVLYRLNNAGSAWEEAGRLQTPRFFHQLVPGPHGSLLAVGGASKDGHLASIEKIDLNRDHFAKKDMTKKPR